MSGCRSSTLCADRQRQNTTFIIIFLVAKDPDQSVADHIEALVTEEHRLLDAAGHGGEGLDTAEHERLEAVRIELDRLWDLMRQRRARRSAGLDPDGAAERDAGTVEGYLG
jgi:hypothetical protein